MTEIDYKRIMVDDTFDLLTTSKSPWPTNWSRARKVGMLSGIILYYEEQDEFEKCELLKKIREKVLNKK